MQGYNLFLQSDVYSIVFTISSSFHLTFFIHPVIHRLLHKRQPFQKCSNLLFVFSKYSIQMKAHGDFAELFSFPHFFKQSQFRRLSWAFLFTTFLKTLFSYEYFSIVLHTFFITCLSSHTTPKGNNGGANFKSFFQHTTSCY